VTLQGFETSQQNAGGADAASELAIEAVAARRQEPKLKLKLKGATGCGEGESPSGGGTAAHSRQAAAKRPRQSFEAGASPKAASSARRGGPSTEPFMSAEQLWAQCDACAKWRRLPESMRGSDELDEAWTCAMHPDPARRGCDAAEDGLGEDEVALSNPNPNPDPGPNPTLVLTLALTLALALTPALALALTLTLTLTATLPGGLCRLDLHIDPGAGHGGDLEEPARADPTAAAASSSEGRRGTIGRVAGAC